jgi:hypothetical protein
MDGKQLFDESFEYPDRPTELEACRQALKETRWLGMSDDEILEYLKVTWFGEDEVQRLAKNIGINPTQKSGPGRRARIS